MQRYGWIDALRGFAALAVLAFHYEALLTFQWPGEWPPPQTQQLHLCLMGVELFFIISGFVILLTLERSKSVQQFAIGRFGRIYPAYLASALVSGAILLAIGAVEPTRVLINLTLLQKFVGVDDLISPYWTLAYELWFYIVMAVIFWCGLLKRVEYIALAWLALAYMVRLSGLDFDSGGRLGLLSMIQFGHLFIAGMMLYLIVSGRRTSCSLVVLALCFLYSSFGRDDWALISGGTYFTVNALFIIGVWVATSGLLRQAPNLLVSLGESSYSLYLFHVPVGFVVIWFADVYHVFDRGFAILIAIPVSLAIAVLSRKYIEIPFQILIKKSYYSPRINPV